MDYVTLGSTSITVNTNGFGALPIQRISESLTVHLFKKAYDNGITFFDTARSYTVSEERIGMAFSGIRDKIIIATKSGQVEANALREELETSLANLKTDYIDIYQFHNPPFCPRPGDDSGLYDLVLEAKAQGKIKHIGISNHRLHVAKEAAESGLYEIVQYPFSYLAAKEEHDLVELCKAKNIGVLAMKAIAGGFITDAAVAYAYLMQFDNVLPIWGIQRESELDEFISFQDSPPRLDDRALRIIEKDRAELTGEYCRGCGYCMPCPAGIGIAIAARMHMLIQRSPKEFYLSDFCRECMEHASECTNCGSCIKKCPYGLDTPRLVREGLSAYQKLL